MWQFECFKPWQRCVVVSCPFPSSEKQLIRITTKFARLSSPKSVFTIEFKMVTGTETEFKTLSTMWILWSKLLMPSDMTMLFAALKIRLNIFNAISFCYRSLLFHSALRGVVILETRLFVLQYPLCKQKWMSVPGSPRNCIQVWKSPTPIALIKSA